ncbi:hypothetical protein A1O1_04995 [Capronia coronata CBS 617.96]|uniref:CBF1-interacting co-repressor CIR N-terminal domain-containing protein n=1 Tax=Capronia coronata CBS 617.96 TaxID=1182541 RepID=W9Y5G3_9EURO|nr:uncharacterized protein A1O1_04995 [Capronia coronata CBS 617.96]EXJ88067.1 hypothetical protein A1O1_04995 [Capronia coronata CBS 617.96]
MPLHLLGKKSWNVYNPANIERVRHDEAEAQKAAEEREKRAIQDEADARIRLLQGKTTDKATLERDGASDNGLDADGGVGVGVKESLDISRIKRIQKRRLAGEDDTDRDIRIARQTQQLASTAPKRQRVSDKNDDDISIVDANGNISLVPVPTTQQQEPKKPLRVEDDPYTVYLSHAAGRGKGAADKPWYSSTSDGNVLAGVNREMEESRAEWGDSSRRRRDRDAMRIAANDPLAMMKQGVKQLREAERLRKEWMEQRERDLREVEDLAARAMKKRRRRREGDENSRERRRRRRRTEDEDRDGDDDEDLKERRRRRSRHDRSVYREERRQDDDDDDEDSLERFDLDDGYSRPEGHDRRHGLEEHNPEEHDHGRRHHRHRHSHRHHDHHHSRHREHRRTREPGHQDKDKRGHNRYTEVS